MAEQTITIPENYFRTLLRRAEFHASESAENLSTVRVPKAVHAELLSHSREYYVLRQVLLQSGLEAETLDLLVQGEPYTSDLNNPTSPLSNDSSNWFQRPFSQPIRIGKAQDDEGLLLAGFNDNPQLTYNEHREPWANPPKRDWAQEDLSPVHDEMIEDDMNPWSERLPPRKSPRTDHSLLLSNLPSDATHKDVTSVIRGGRLIDIWIRKNERVAVVTFAEGAADFLTWARRNDIYIHTKRVQVSWSDRQFAVPPHLQSKLTNGHSRNLVIRGALGKVTEAQLREDMEHIHNLVLVAFVWRGNDIYVSTNSIDKATFARNCMLSRLPYKGLKIDWYPDECSEPLPQVQPRNLPPMNELFRKQASNASPAIANRFDLLTLDDDNRSSTTIPESDINNDDDDESQLSGILLRPRSAETGVVEA